MSRYDENRIFGIDLGTTFSSIAYVNEYGIPKIVPNAEGHNTTPSVIYIDGSNILVGVSALEAEKLHPENTVRYVKRSINQPGYRFENQGDRFSVEELSSFILRKLAQDAQSRLGAKVENVVITCPAYFGVNERASVRIAGEIAGLKVRQIVNEPTAAAIAYGAGQLNEPKKILVYDLGGGTFDITMIDIRPKSIKVIGTGGDPMLGGKDFNDRMVDFVAYHFYKQTGLDPSRYNLTADHSAFSQIHEQVEAAKKTLGKAPSAKINFGVRGEKFSVEITREVFAALTKELVDKTLDLTSGMLKDARKKGYSKFDEIILVGGSSYLPQVAKGINSRFGIAPKLYLPEEAIARGAAIFGWKLFLRDRLVESIASRVSFDLDLEELADNLEKVARKAQNSLPGFEELNEDLKLELDAPWDPSEKAERDRKVKRVLEEEVEDININISSADIDEAVKEVAQETGLPSAAVRNSMMEIQDVASKSMGFVMKSKGNQELVFVVVPKNSLIPARGEKTFATAAPNQKGIQIRLVESEEDQVWIGVEDTKEIGKAMVLLPPDLPAKTPLKITFSINKEGRLSMTATEMHKGRVTEFTIVTTTVVSGEELVAAKKRKGRISVK
jgi:molecular chaperone DnaK (HSP70)